jgi:hypothetical protein
MNAQTKRLRDEMTRAAQTETRAVRTHLAAGEPAEHPELDRAQAAYRAARAAFELAYREM